MKRETMSHAVNVFDAAWYAAMVDVIKNGYGKHTRFLCVV